MAPPLMAAPGRRLLLLMFGFCSVAASGVCPRRDLAFLDVVGSQCAPWIKRSLSIQVNGETLDKELTYGQKTHYSILFYASWCPFSRTTQHTFDNLSMMFPQIKHLVVEESFVSPSVFSRYGVHSFPTIVVVNGTRRVRYHGSKDLNSLVLFYRRVTGLDPVADFSLDGVWGATNACSFSLWNRTPREILFTEPYLAFSLMFICCKVFLYFFPEILSRLKFVCLSYVWHVNRGIFGEGNQLLERALHIIDVKRLWSKFWLSHKARNFQKGANNARVWASSLASVSLGEPSSSRSSPLD